MYVYAHIHSKTMDYYTRYVQHTHAHLWTATESLLVPSSL